MKKVTKKEDLPRMRLRANPWFRLFENHGYEPPPPLLRTVDGQCPVKYDVYIHYTIRFFYNTDRIIPSSSTVRCIGCDRSDGSMACT